MSLLVHTPALWSYLAVPLLLDTVLALALYVSLLRAGFRRIGALTAGLPAWAAFVGDILRAVLAVLLFIGIAFIMTRLAVLLGSPWYGQLSERVEDMVSEAPFPEEPVSVGSVVRSVGRALLFEAQKFLLVMSVSVALLALNLVPGFGQLLWLLGTIALGGLIAALDYLSGPLDRRRASFRSRITVIRTGLPTAAGFGFACFFLTFIPLVNIVTIPVCVVAGTMLYCERLRPARTVTVSPTARPPGWR